MDACEVQKRIAEITALVTPPPGKVLHGNEPLAHAQEDSLLVDVLRSIAEGTAQPDAQALAREALRVCDLPFCRWYE